MTQNLLTGRRWRGRLVVPIRGPGEIVVLQDQQVFGHKGPRRRGARRRVQDVPVVDINLVKNFLFVDFFATTNLDIILYVIHLLYLKLKVIEVSF